MRRIVGATAAVVLGTLLAAVSGVQAGTPVFTLNITVGGCFSGTGPPESTLAIRWKSISGVLKGSFSVLTNSGGTWFLPDTACDAAFVQGGDFIRESMNSQSHSFTVPSLSLAFDRDTDVVSGRSKPGSSVHLDVWLNPLAPTFELDPVCSTNAPVNSQGTFSHDFTNCDGSGYTATGGQFVDATWNDGVGDQLWRRSYAPFVSIKLGSAGLGGFVTPAATTTIQLRTSTGTQRATAVGQPTPDGVLAATLKNPGGTPVAVAAGNRIVGDWAGAVAFVIPQLTLAIDAGANTIVGHCMPHVPWYVLLRQGNASESYAGTTTASGATTKTDAWLTDVQTGDRVDLLCQRRSGDRLHLVRVVP
jgi:hypothetical protein